MSERPVRRWIRLRDSGQGDGSIEVPSIPSGVDSGFGMVRFAIGPQGQPRLMVPCGTGVVLRKQAASEKLHVGISRYDVGGKTTLFVDVMCVDRVLDPVFAELAEEVVHRIASGHGPAEAVESTIADFRNLLNSPSNRDVSDQEIVGLVGELYVLRLLANISPTAIEAWTGPFDQRHDFRRANRSLEVKTSTRSDATSILISSIEQLAEPTGGFLTLVHLNMERAAGGTLSVSGLVREMLALGVSEVGLGAALAAMGCADPQSDAWNHVRYSMERITGYEVREGFPRITSAQFATGSLPPGIVSVNYEVDLRAAEAFRQSQPVLQSQLEWVAS